MRDVDLNLLSVFDVVMAERSLTRAADRLATTQPAISHALARLRAVHGDPLFVRAGRGVRPTPRAVELFERTHEPMEVIRGAARPATADLRSLRRAVRLMAAVPVVAQVCVPLRRVLDVEAPGIDLYVMPDASDAPERLERASIDLAVTVFPAASPALHVEPLGEVAFACVMRSGHPLASRPLDDAAYAAAAHLVVSTSVDPRSRVDAALAGRGLSRRIAMSVYHPGDVPGIVAITDLIATVPPDVLPELQDRRRFVVRPVPLELPPVTVALVWHERSHRDATMRWLRRRIAALSAGLA